MSLKQKTISGLLWSFIDNFAKLGITFVVGIILARLLTPTEFGLIGMTTIFIAVAQSFIDSGFKQALIRKQNCTQADFSTVFYFNLLVSFSSYILLFLFSDFISQFFDEPQLTSIIRVLGLILIVNGLALVQIARLTKEINFKLQTNISVISSLVSGTIGISMALAGYGVWSLVATTLSGSIVSTLLLWLWNRWHPSLIFSMESFKEMFSFGSRLLVSGLIDTIYNNIYLLVIGRYFSASDLGYYTRADAFKNVPSQNITGVVQRVSYPVLSTLQSDIPKLRSAYRKLIKSTMLITFVLMLGMAAVAEPMILALLGEQWRDSIVYLQLLCFVGMFYPLQSINLNMLKVQGRTDLFLRLEVIKKLLAIPIIVIGVIFGIEIMIVGMIINSFIAYYLNSYWSGKFIGYSIGQQVKDIFPSLLLATANGLIVFCVGYLLNLSPLVEFVVQVAIGTMLTIGIAEFMHLDSYLYIKEI
ncbi:MAG: lipopolysaccharide biosynthesis protein, partial [Anaerolineales bacterium]|nr:lipopolysaccharide biosynthesis protein [Anaerolineales bacterium]